MAASSGVATNSCEKYNIQNDEWTEITSLTTKKYCLGGCLFNDRYIYIFGGYSGGGALEDIEIFDCENEKGGWKKVTIVNKGGWSARYWNQAIQVDALHILIYGGDGKKESFIFDVYKREFKQVANLKEASYFQCSVTDSAVLREGKVYAIDGSKRIHIYDLATDVWDMINFP